MITSGNRRLTVEEFLEINSGSEERYELVEGIAFSLARADERRNVIRSNVLTALVPAAKRAGCRATSFNTAVLTGPDTIRYPDVVVDCGPRDDNAMIASKPVIVVDVSAPGTDPIHGSDRLREYKRLENIDTIIRIEAETRRVDVHRKLVDRTWSHQTVERHDVVESAGLQICGRDNAVGRTPMKNKHRVAFTTRRICFEGRKVTSRR